ncbi:MAG: Rha family transcriptional regulator [Liquorilactobacillus hordei]|uniref:Rha family transcriptional regulator n=1 Tax=Liquorilactobacillus hordei TaxID=468911 RepID=UPI0039E8A7E5
MEIQTLAPKITIDSREVAKMLDKRHADLMRDIRGYKNDLDQNANLRSDDFFVESVYRAGTGKEYSCYLLTKAGCEFVANKMTGKKGNIFTAEYIQKFNEMESSMEPAHIKLPQTPMEALKLMFQAQDETDKKMQKVETRVEELEDNQVIPQGDYGYIGRRISQRVTEVGHGFGELTSKQRGELFRDINNGVKRIAGVGSRSQLRTKHYQRVVDFINDWEPSTATKTILRQIKEG